jgi:hypothetical protein
VVNKENPNGIDQIKETIMKNNYSEGGMKVTDVESLERSLKLKQFFRAHNSNHVIIHEFRGWGMGGGRGLKVSPSPYEIFVKGYPPILEKMAVLKKFLTFFGKKCHFFRNFLGPLEIITNLQ